MSTPSKEAPRPYPQLPPGGWSAEKIRAALLDLEKGYLGPASRLVRAMIRHPRYVQGRDQFIGAVTGCPLEVIGANVTYNGVGMSRRLAEGAGEMLSSVLRDGAERWLIEWFKMMPLVVGYLTWNTDVRPWIPVALTRWPLEAVRVDLYNNKLYATMQTGREEEIVPGNGTWVVGWQGGPFNFNAGLIHALGETWVRGINANRDVANRAQMNASQILVSETPEGETMESAATLSVGEKLQNAQQGGLAGIQLPPRWPVPKPLDLASTNAMPSLELAVKTSNTDMLVPWLMQDGTATNEGGSLAKAQVLDGVLYSSVAGLIRDLYGEITPAMGRVSGLITDQIVKPWVKFQLDPESGVSLDRVCPLALRRVPDLEEDTRLKAEADRGAAFWGEVSAIETTIRRDLTADELTDLAKTRGVRVPETVLRDRGVPKTVASDGGGGVSVTS